MLNSGANRLEIMLRASSERLSKHYVNVKRVKSSLLKHGEINSSVPDKAYTEGMNSYFKKLFQSLVLYWFKASNTGCWLFLSMPHIREY